MLETSDKLAVERNDHPLERLEDATDALLSFEAILPYTRDERKSSSNSCADSCS